METLESCDFVFRQCYISSRFMRNIFMCFRLFDNGNAGSIPNLNVHILIANDTEDRLSKTLYYLGNVLMSVYNRICRFLFKNVNITFTRCFEGFHRYHTIFLWSIFSLSFIFFEIFEHCEINWTQYALRVEYILLFSYGEEK